MLMAEGAVEIWVLSRPGKSIREIARMLEVSRNSVRRYLRREGLPRYQRQARPSKLDAYKRYLEEPVTAAAPEWIPATVLLRELRVHAATGEIRLVRLELERERLQPLPTPWCGAIIAARDQRAPPLPSG
ncbi:MAG TPA: hypothetical protein VMF50_07655, partial [Candidatus Binataceae bacterium]|nr:hypothetical protein [Candidatus Binataceae bacterium]